MKPRTLAVHSGTLVLLSYKMNKTSPLRVSILRRRRRIVIKYQINHSIAIAVIYRERKFFVFHEYGIAVYEPSACRLHHQIHSSDMIPGTQEYVCGDKGSCSWGRSINVGNYIYVTQPLRDRILVISTIQIVVVIKNLAFQTQATTNSIIYYNYCRSMQLLQINIL